MCMRVSVCDIMLKRVLKEFLQHSEESRGKPACQMLEGIRVGAMPCRGLLCF